MDFLFLSSVVVLLIAFFALVKSADLLISTATVLGERIGLNRFIIGLTIVAIGTSLPELFTSISGIFKSSNSTSFIVGTLLGSNISNILLIFGILIFFSKKFKYQTSKFDLTMFGFSTVALIGLVFFGFFSILQGILFLGIYVWYLYRDITHKGKEKYSSDVNEDDSGLAYYMRDYKLFSILFLFVLSLLGLNFSSGGVVFGIELIGGILNIPLSYLTLTTVALATSLPEAIVTYTSARNEEYDLAVGNIIGSNISNVFFIGGVVGLLKQFNFINVEYFASCVFLIIATAVFMFFLHRQGVRKYHGIFVLVLYFTYIVSTFLL